MSGDVRGIDFEREEWEITGCESWCCDLLLDILAACNKFASYHYYALSRTAVGNINADAVVPRRTILRIVCNLRLHDVSRREGNIDFKWKTFVTCFGMLTGFDDLQNHLLSLWIVTRSMMLMLSFTQFTLTQVTNDAVSLWLEMATGDPHLKQWKPE